MISCYIGLGSNLDEPGEQVTRAFSELTSLENSNLVSRSSLYRSKPLGPQDQADFINAVVELHTSLPATSLLEALQAIESVHKRVRTTHWGPRTLDLDILLYGQENIRTAKLHIPHPEIINRNFVLIPLYEIAPELTIPAMGNLAELVAKIDQSGLERIDDDSLPHE